MFEALLSSTDQNRYIQMSQTFSENGQPRLSRSVSSASRKESGGGHQPPSTYLDMVSKPDYLSQMSRPAEGDGDGYLLPSSSAGGSFKMTAGNGSLQLSSADADMDGYLVATPGPAAVGGSSMRSFPPISEE